MTEQQKLQTVERAFKFLEYVASTPEAPTVQEISTALNLNITTCYHVMRTLLALGYLERGPDASLKLGAKIGTLYQAYHKTFDLDQSLATLVDGLVQQTLETSFVSVLQGDQVVLKVLTEGTRRLRVSGLFVGLSGSEHIRASGKAVLAHVDEETRRAILAKSLAGLAARDRKRIAEQLEAELKLIRSRGWSIDKQWEEGATGLAAPVFDGAGRIYGAVGIIAPNFYMERMREQYIHDVQLAATGVTTLLRDVIPDKQKRRRAM
ncbi:IclR family transcriptional regulator [Rhizobium sp. BR 362]|uniref:IclR family transcriptional regulator n=1 Tax=Rhizobium sp. BR 362 TaxID=3040670 RepID=UPI002F402F65